MSKPTRAEYEALIAARVHEAVRVPFRVVHLLNWEPARNDCHNNVDTWVASRSGAMAVRGWLIESIGSLTAHSVIRDHDGQLFDVTPFLDESLRLGFIEHRGDEASFWRMKAQGVQIFCPTADPEEIARELEAMTIGPEDHYD